MNVYMLTKVELDNYDQEDHIQFALYPGTAFVSLDAAKKGANRIGKEEHEISGRNQEKWPDYIPVSGWVACPSGTEWEVGDENSDAVWRITQREILEG